MIVKTFTIAWLIPLSLIVLSGIVILKTSLEIQEVGKKKDLETSSKKYAKKMPKWFLKTRYPVFFAALFLLF